MMAKQNDCEEVATENGASDRHESGDRFPGRAPQPGDGEGCGTMLVLGLGLGMLALRLVVGG